MTFRCNPGFLMSGDLSDQYVQLLFWNTQVEAVTTGFLCRWLAPGDVFYDLGANIGYFTLLAASMLRAEGTVIAFEPNPTAREQLVANLDVNGFADVLVRSEAVGSASASGVLYQPDEYTTGSTLAAPEDGATAREFSVEVRSLDGVAAETGHSPTVIKMDVEGWEDEVIRGASRLLSSAHPPLIIAEVNEAATARAGKSADAWLEALEEHGYRFLDLQGRYVGLWLPKRPRHWARGVRLRRLRGYFNIAAYRPDAHGARVEQVLRAW